MRGKEVIIILSVALFFSAASVAYSWTTPTNLGANVNSSSEDNEPGVTPNGNTLYFTSKRGGNYDIWQSIYSGGKWQPATRTPYVYSSSYDGNPAFLQSTYLEMYLTSNRGGNMDIYQSVYRNGRWQTPSRLPTTVNTNYAEYGCGLFRRSGRATMAFSSTRPGGEGGYDIWATEYRGGWVTAWRVSGPSTSAQELTPTVTLNGAYMYFSSNRSGGHGGFDLYVSRWTGSYWGTASNLGSKVNTSYNDVSPGVTTNGQRLYFASNRPGGRGGGDIWMTLNTTAVAPASLGRVKALFR
jgi:Tol biopolymer transport system component